MIIALLSLFSTLQAFIAPALIGEARAADPRYSTLYFGFARPLDSKAPGHAFFVLTHKPRELLGGRAYQYNISLPAQFTPLKAKTKMAYFRGLYEKWTKLSIMVQMTREDAFVSLHRYSATRYKTTLYELNMTAEQIKGVQAALEKDYAARKDTSALFSYSLMKDNLITNAIDFLNSLVDKKEQVEVTMQTDRGNILSYFSHDAWLSNVPISIMTDLHKSSFVRKEGTFSIRPGTGTRDQVSRAISIQVKRMGKACGWSDEKIEEVKPLIVDENSRYLNSVETWLSGEIATCSKKKTPLQIYTLQDLLFFDLNDYSALDAGKKALHRKWLKSLISEK